MGNAPSTSNPNSPRRRIAQLGRSSTSTSTSTISHLIPGAEPSSPEQHIAIAEPEHRKSLEHITPAHELVHVATLVEDDEDEPASLEHRPSGEVARFLEDSLEGGATPKPARKEELDGEEADVGESCSRSDDLIDLEAGIQFGGYDVEDIQELAGPAPTSADDIEAPVSSGPYAPENVHVSPTGLTEGTHDGELEDRNHKRADEGLSLHVADELGEHAQDRLSQAPEPQQQHSLDYVSSRWTPGVYILINMKSGTALDLAGHNEKSVIGWPNHGGPNQQWEFVPSGQGFTVRSAASPPDPGLYLTIKESVRDGAELDVCEFPMSWRVQQDEATEALRISWAHTDYVLGLENEGDASPGAKAELRKAQPSDPSQMWKFVQCPSAHATQGRVTRAVTQPFATETVIVSEDQDCTTVTRTVMTTTVETITTVTRVAHARHG